MRKKQKYYLRPADKLVSVDALAMDGQRQIVQRNVQGKLIEMKSVLNHSFVNHLWHIG